MEVTRRNRLFLRRWGYRHFVPFLGEENGKEGHDSARVGEETGCVEQFNLLRLLDERDDWRG